jgi:antitoxin component YwqK of YwqJK toxin-antitoxin module
MLLLVGNIGRCLAQATKTKIEIPQNTGNGLNQYNTAKQKNGTWYESVEPLRGEPGHHYFGNYINGRKEGLWYKMDFNGNILNIEMFRNNVRNGMSQYFENGKLISTGIWRGLNPKYAYDTVLVVDIVNGNDFYVAVPSEKGSVEHGTWRYYDPNSGQLMKEIEFQVGYIISTTSFEVKSTLDSTTIKNIENSLPHNKKIYYKPPAGKGKKL